jgi:transcriptional regulator with XRE-family HTH domain
MPLATCHPDRPHRAHGLCNTCYGAQWDAAHGPRPRTRSTPAPCHPERLHHAKGLCRTCYARYLDHRNGAEPRTCKPTICGHPGRRKSGGLCAPCSSREYRANKIEQRQRLLQERGIPTREEYPPIPAAVLKRWRLAHGWTTTQLGRALGYSPSSWLTWEHGTVIPPPSACQYVQEHPAPRQSREFASAGPGMLRRVLRQRGLRVIEMADFCGVAEGTVHNWLNGHASLPLGVRAWVHAGGPHDWRWAPFGQDNVLSVGGHPRGSRAQVRPPAKIPQVLPALATRWAVVDRSGAPPACVSCDGPTKWGKRRHGACVNCAAREANAAKRERQAS